MAKGFKLRVWPVVGALAFVIGLLIAVLAGFMVTASQEVAFALGSLGIIVGLINVTDEEVQKFLISTTALVVAASSLATILARLPLGGGAMTSALANIVAFVAPAAGVVALKAIYDIARNA